MSLQASKTQPEEPSSPPPDSSLLNRQPKWFKPAFYGDVTPGNILELGSCGFAYISGLSTTGDPTSPLVAFALIIAGTTKFDPKPFDRKAVFLRVDNSVTSVTIHKDGHIYRDGIDLLSPENPIWGGKSPEIHYPDL